MALGAAAAAAALCAVVLAAGCGGSAKPKADPGAEARVVAELSAACRALDAGQAGARPTRVEPAAARRRRAALEAELVRTSAYLPAGRAFAKARAERSKLLAGLHSGPDDATRMSGFEVFKRLYGTQLQLYAAERALGLSACAGRRPRPPIEG